MEYCVIWQMFKLTDSEQVKGLTSIIRYSVLVSKSYVKHKHRQNWIEWNWEGQRIRYLPHVGLTSYHEVMLNIDKSLLVYIGGLKYVTYFLSTQYEHLSKLFFFFQTFASSIDTNKEYIYIIICSFIYSTTDAKGNKLECMQSISHPSTPLYICIQYVIPVSVKITLVITYRKSESIIPASSSWHLVNFEHKAQ